MTRTRYELDTRVLTVFFFVAMPFVAFGSFIVVSMARASLRESLGVAFEQRAIETKLVLERYVGDQILHLRLLALEPQVLAAVAAPFRARSADEARRLEQAWASGSDPKAIAPLVSSPLANRLRELAAVRPAVRLFQVVDAEGRLVAATSRGGRLLYGDIQWFQALRDGLPGRPHVEDVQQGPAGAPYFAIACAVHHATEGRFLGAVRALLDAGDLYGVLGPVRVGRSGRAMLLRSTDGMILASDDSQRVLRETFPGFETIQMAMSDRRSSWALPETRQRDRAGDRLLAPARLAAFTAVDQVPNISWLVLVQQDAEEAMAPIQQVTRYLWIHFIGAFASVILLALYFSFKLEAPVIEEELHLHEEHVPSSMRAET